MSSAEFSLWIEAYKVDQWGDRWHDWRAGLIASTIGNFAGRTLNSGTAGLTPEDFMPRFGDQEPEVIEEVDPIAYFTAVANSKQFNKG